MQDLIYYWRGSADVRVDILTELASRSFEVMQFRTLDEVLQAAVRNEPKLLIVDGTAGDREASDRTVELSTARQIFEWNLMFISTAAVIKLTQPIEYRR